MLELDNPMASKSQIDDKECQLTSNIQKQIEKEQEQLDLMLDELEDFKIFSSQSKYFNADEADIVTKQYNDKITYTRDEIFALKSNLESRD